MSTHDEARWLADEELKREIEESDIRGAGESDRQVGGTHYVQMDIEPWDVIDTFPVYQFIGYHRGVALSYIMRAGSKGDTAVDLEKAAHHLLKCVEHLRRNHDETP